MCGISEGHFNPTSLNYIWPSPMPTIQQPIHNQRTGTKQHSARESLMAILQCIGCEGKNTGCINETVLWNKMFTRICIYASGNSVVRGDVWIDIQTTRLVNKYTYLLKAHFCLSCFDWYRSLICLISWISPSRSVQCCFHIQHRQQWWFCQQ